MQVIRLTFDRTSRRNWVSFIPLLGLLGSLAICGCQQEPVSDPKVPVADETADNATDSSGPDEREELPPLIVEAPGEPPEGMVWIPGGTFSMGDPESGSGDDRYLHRVELDGFYMDATEITNRQFKSFIDATGYVTIAERTPKAEDFAGQVEDISQIPKENLVPGSICFNANFDRSTLRRDHPLWTYQVWMYTKGAC